MFRVHARREVNIEPMGDFETMGRRVRERRLRFGLTTKELAKRAGISRSTLVRLEAGQPTAASSVERIRMALQLYADHLVVPIGSEPFNIHRTDQKHWIVSVPKTAYQRGADDEDPQHVDDPVERRRLGNLGFQPLFTTILGIEMPDGVGSHFLMEVHGDTEINRHFGEEFVYCLKGPALVRVDGHDCVLNEGDAMTFDATIPHNYGCAPERKPSDPPSLLLIVISMRPGERPVWVWTPGEAKEQA